MSEARRRVRSVDIARGFVLVLMALDHVRDFLTNAPFDPLNTGQISASYFFTRWVTHLCAPMFVFLAGTSAFLRMRAGASTKNTAFYLASRGLVLIALEATVVGFAWWFRWGPSDPGLTLQVIWVIGASMVVLSALIFLPRWAILTVALVLIAGHDAVTHAGNGAAWLKLLHDPGRTALGPFRAFVVYPLIPWVGVMAVGYVSGPLFGESPKRRRAFLLSTATLLAVSFVALRCLGLYGDPEPFDPGAPVPWMSFLDVAKYPPSLQYLLITGSLGALCLAVADSLPKRIADPLVVYGKASLFFYVVHLYVCHVAAVIVGVAQGFSAPQFFTFVFNFPDGFGLALPWVYVAWVAIVAGLYQSCRRYGELRRKYPRVLSYF